MPARKEGWESLLNSHIETHLNKPQLWGENDCCLFACDWILRATGTDPAREFRGKYKTKAGAYRLLKKFAGTLDETANKIFDSLGMQETIKTMARRGDVALVPGNGGNALGIIDSSGMRVAIQGKEGLDYIPINDAIKAWRVG